MFFIASVLHPILFIVNTGIRRAIAKTTKNIIHLIVRDLVNTALNFKGIATHAHRITPRDTEIQGCFKFLDRPAAEPVCCSSLKPLQLRLLLSSGVSCSGQMSFFLAFWHLPDATWLLKVWVFPASWRYLSEGTLGYLDIPCSA
ncbi:hypothetical protein ElyMa_006780300 [Elysia marginata]|uniref:Uncharacterized protein n=1 Tax=Elysia marginata TaxID=1093978 RepID=A0AAV4J0E5_9GAST|nr:hypothetical protein ElyMa_006780300 [Elysia marginata]